MPSGKKAFLNAWRAFCRSWLGALGPPKIIAVDEDCEVAKEFSFFASGNGSRVSAVVARAPWGNGLAEHAGGRCEGLCAAARESGPSWSKAEAWCARPPE